MPRARLSDDRFNYGLDPLPIRVAGNHSATAIGAGFAFSAGTGHGAAFVGIIVAVAIGAVIGYGVATPGECAGGLGKCHAGCKQAGEHEQVSLLHDMSSLFPLAPGQS